MDWNTATLTELQAGLRSGKFSATDLLEAHIATIEQVNPAVNGLVADRLKASRSSGRGRSLHTGDLDLPPSWEFPAPSRGIGVEGQPQTGGVLWRKDVVAERDATVQRLRAAGAIIIGTTNIQKADFGSRPTTRSTGEQTTPGTPQGRGGSSGGEGALDPTGAVPFGLGSDVGGSIRIPAAFCGTVGHNNGRSRAQHRPLS